MGTGYHGLTVWRRAMDVADTSYLVSAEFPASARFGLTSQLRKSAISVVSNVAEGRGRRSTREFRRFVDIAYGSLCELETQMLLAERLGFVAEQDLKRFSQLAAETGRLLNGLRNSLTLLEAEC